VPTSDSLELLTASGTDFLLQLANQLLILLAYRVIMADVLLLFAPTLDHLAQRLNGALLHFLP